MRFECVIMSFVLAAPAALLAQKPQQKPKLSMEQAQKIALEKEPGKIEKQRAGKRAREADLFL